MTNGELNNINVDNEKGKGSQDDVELFKSQTSSFPQTEIHSSWKIRPVLKVSLEQFIIVLLPLGPEPAFRRLDLGGSSGGYSSYGYTSHASLCADSAQLGGDRLFSNVYLLEDPPQHF